MYIYIFRNVFFILLTCFSGNDSLLVRLREAGIETPEEYITFHGLRNHAILDSLPVGSLNEN